MSKTIIAITGPSGTGKTVLSKFLRNQYGYPFPIHTTTREKRPDDEPNFYRYISRQEFRQKIEQGLFLFWSQYKERYYGILKEDLEKAYWENDGLIINVNYMDLDQISAFKSEYSITIVRLAFHDVETMIKQRTERRGQKPEDTAHRVEVALRNEALHTQQIQDLVDITCYSDDFPEKEMIQRVIEMLVEKGALS